MRRSLWIGALLLVIAWGLRVPFLTFHSMWLDEAVAVWVARLPPAVLLERTMAFKEEASPPLYFLLLKGWMALAGDGEFAVRLFSTWWILFGLAWLWRLGALFPPRVLRILVLALGASQPYLIWFGQEARVYGLLFALSAMSTVWLLKALRTDRHADWALYALTMAAAWYVHLTAIFLTVAHLGMAAAARRSIWSFRAGRGVLIVLAIAGMPLALRAWGGQQGAILWWNPQRPLLEAFREVLEAWTVYQAPSPSLALLGGVYSAGILSLGALSQHRLRPGLMGLALGLVFWYLASQRFPLTSPRYWMSLTPLALSAFALSIRGSPAWHPALQRAWFSLSVAGWIGLVAIGFRSLWSPLNAKEDWRGAAGWVAAHAGPRDFALFFAEYVRFPFFYYYRKSIDHGAFAHPIPDLAAATETLGRFPLEDHDTLWYIRAHADWADPLDRIDQALRARYPVRMEVFPEKIRIRAYALRWTRPSLPSEARLVEHRFEAGWVLVGFHHAGGSGISPRAWGVFPLTRQLHLTLYWRRLPDAVEDVAFQVALIRPDGTFRLDGNPPRDGVLERYPPRTWPVGPLVVDDRDFFLPIEMPSGRYHLVLTVGYPAGSMESMILDVVEVR